LTRDGKEDGHAELAAVRAAVPIAFGTVSSCNVAALSRRLDEKDLPLVAEAITNRANPQLPLGGLETVWPW